MRALLAGAGAAGTTSSVPHLVPGLGIAKHAAISAVDLTMLGGIYYAYFDERPDGDKLKEMLADAGIIVATGGALVYGGVKAMDWITNELLQILPVVGQMAAGVVSGSVSGAVGGLWWLACDKAYREETSPALVAREVFAF